jgi:hyperosmotically inducible periplasmic protein
MNMKLASSLLVAGTLMLPLAGYAADAKSEGSSPSTFMKDSVITGKVTAGLAEEKFSSLVQINVDTDDKGAVTLSGSAPNKSAADKAVTIARAVTGVTSVHNDIQIKAD